MLTQMPPAMRAFVTKPPLLKGESPEEYWNFVASVIDTMAPADVIDWCWTLRFADGAWDVFRKRRLRTAYVNTQYRNAVHRVVRGDKFPPVPYQILSGVADAIRKEADEIAVRCLADPAQLAENNIDPDHVAATALHIAADALEKFDRMIERAERACDAIMELIEMRRSVFASRAREAGKKVLRDVAYRVVEQTADSESPLPDQTTAAVKAAETPA